MTAGASGWRGWWSHATRGVAGAVLLSGMMGTTASRALAGDEAGKPEAVSESDRAAYPQRVSVKVGEGAVVIKAARGVRPAALRVAGRLLRKILAETDESVVKRLGGARLEVILVSDMARFTDTPDLRDLARARNAFGQSLDVARGIFRMREMPWSKSTRPSRNAPIVVVGEEDVLRIIPCGPQSNFHHEVAHAVHMLGMTREQRSGWREVYDGARERGLFKNRYAALNEDEFFADLSQAYFDVAPYFCSRAQLARVDADAYRFLTGIYSARRAAAEPPKAG